MSARVLTIFLTLSVLAVGCGEKLASHSSPGRYLEYPKTSVIKLNWRKKLHSNVPNFIVPEFYEEHDRFAPVETAGAAYDWKHKRILIGAGVGGFYCIDAQSGTTVWRFDLDDSVGSVPIFDGAQNRVFFGADDGMLYGLHAFSGRLLWSTNTGAEMKKRVWMRNDTLFVVTADNTVLAVEPDNGDIIWRYRRDPVDGFSSVGHGDIAFYGNNIIAGFADGTVAAMDMGTGEEVWVFDLSTEVLARADRNEVVLIDVDATPLVIDDVVVVASFDGGTYGVSAATGDVVWSRSDLTKVTGAANYVGEAVLARSEVGGVVSLDPASGETIYETRFGLGLKADPVVYDDLLLISDSEAGLYMVSGGTGEVLNLLDVNGGFFARPTVAGRTLTIMGNWSTLFYFDLN